jgi:phage-related protein
MALQTFTWTTFYTPKVKYGHYVISTEMESGTKQKKYKRRKPTVWTLTFQCLYSEMAAIAAFFNARKGSFEAFYWTDPYSETTKTVRFKNDDLDIESEWKINGIFEVELEEVL